LDAPLAQTATNFGPKSCYFGKLLPVPKLCKKISTMCIYDNGNSEFRAKNYYFSATFSIWGLMGQDVKMCCRKCHIWNHRNADLDLPIYYTTFTGLRWWLRVVYSWVPPLLTVFGRKIQSCFRPKFDGFGDKLGFKIKFNFI